MSTNFGSAANDAQSTLSRGTSLISARAGEIEIAGRRYVTAERLATMLGVTVRTLTRWNAARIGPPKIKVGKLVLFELSSLPVWLASRETEPVRAAGRRR